MSFLKQFGINLVTAVEQNHGQLEDELVNDPPAIPSSGDRANEKQNFLESFSVTEVVQRFLFFCKTGKTHIYVDHPEEMIEMTTFKIDKDGDVVLKDYECPDCDMFGGCSHCELEHSVLKLENFLVVEKPFSVTESLGKLYFSAESELKVYNAGTWNLVTFWFPKGLVVDTFYILI